MEEQFTNHSEEVTETPQETVVPETYQEEVAQEAPATTQEQDFFEVKYNKELKKISRDEAPTYIQKGLNYDKVKQELEQTRQQTAYLDKLAKLSGYESQDAFLQAVEEMEQQQHVQQQAQQFGIDEETFKRQLQPKFDELDQVKSQLEQMKRENFNRLVESELSELQKNENFSTYEKDMWDLALQYGMTLSEAFEFASLRGLKQSIPDLQKQTEQRVVDQIRARQGKHVETSDENTTVSLGLTPEEVAMAQKMGLTPEEYAKWK